MKDQLDKGAAARGALAYVLWGFVVLFWPLVKSAGAWEILAHRIVWSLVFVVICLLVTRRPWTWLRQVRRHWPRLTLAAVLVSLNWVTFIWAINHGHVAETSLGYFLNPLLNVLIGAVVFGERLSRASLAAIVVAAAGVVVIGVAMTSTVWVALALAGSFAAYGAVKKKAPLGALEGLAFESGVLTPIALTYLLLLPDGRFGNDPTVSLWLAAAGPVTAIPLWLFAIATARVPLSLLGMIQFITPTMQLLLGVLVIGQRVPPAYWVGLGLVWLGLALYVTTLLRARPAPTASPVPEGAEISAA